MATAVTAMVAVVLVLVIDRWLREYPSPVDG